MDEKLAIDGGKPVRENPLPQRWPGARWIGEEEKKLIIDVIDNQSPFRYYGPNVLDTVSTFEKEFSRKIGAKYSLGVTSGTAALRVALGALGIGPGDEVIVPAHTFIASAGAVITSRAIPIFAETDESMNIDPQDFERKITPRTKVVMPVHIQGVACRMDKIMKIAKEHNLLVLEDCAQSMGASFNGKKVGSIGDMGAFSFQLAKVITSGEGGVVCTNDKELYERAVCCHDHGNVRHYHREIIGKEMVEPFCAEQYRMSELTGAVALAQFRKLSSIIQAMKKSKRKIKQAISDLRELRFREIPDEEGEIGYDLMFFLKEERQAKRFIEALNKENIGAFQQYDGVCVYLNPQILHKQTVTKEGCPFTCPYYKGDVEYKLGLCQKTEKLLKSSVSIQISSVFTDRDCEDVVRGIRKVYQSMFK